MPDLIAVFENWWKQITGIAVIMASIALLISLLLPKKYLGSSTALPVNSVVSDRGRIFNQNIQGLYSSIGDAEELDKIEGTSKLDTVYLSVVRDLNLQQHYGFSSNSEGEMKSVVELKKNSDISRTGYNELRVRVWDTDRNLCSIICNGLMNQLQKMHSKILHEVDSIQYAALSSQIESKMQSYDSASTSMANKGELNSSQYQDILNQYQVALASNTPALIIVERARPAIWADKPEIVKVTLIAFVASFMFSFLLFYFIYSRK